LHDKVVDAVSTLLDEGRKSGREMVSNLLKVELAWLNTAHPNFIGGSRAVLQAMTRLQEEREKERERQALIRARTLGIFGNPDKVEGVLEGNAQGYAPPADASAPPEKRRGSWRFWKKKNGARNRKKKGGGGGSDDNDDEDEEEGEEGEYEEDEDYEYDSQDEVRGSRGGGGGGAGGAGYEARRVTTGKYGSTSDPYLVKLPPMPPQVLRNYAIKNEKETIEVLV
jgi:hypothetical protein